MVKSIFMNLNINEFKDLIKECLSEVKDTNPTMRSNLEEDLLTQRQAAKYLQISEPTIIKWKKQKKLPYYQNGRSILYKKSELLQALRKNNHLIEN